MTERKSTPQRGEIWLIQFDPVVGMEIGKTRPVVVVNENNTGYSELKIIVPITYDKGRFTKLPWFTAISCTRHNGLSKNSEADSSQVKSVSVRRFARKLGEATPEQLKEIVAGIALCVGFE